MNTSELNETLDRCIVACRLCRLTLRGRGDAFFCFPLDCSDTLLLCVREDDFLLDGYAVFPLTEVSEARADESLSARILDALRVPRAAAAPAVSLRDWESLFSSLLALRADVIVECGGRHAPYPFSIGRIEAVSDRALTLRHFDADGVWERAPREIDYGAITGVSFGTRYILTLTKYLPRP